MFWKRALVAALAGAATFGFQAVSAGGHARSKAIRMSLQPAVAGTKLKLLYTVENWDQPNATIVANVSLPLDAPTTVRCPKVTGCTLIAEVAAELALLEADGSVGLCVYIDGADANPGCNYIAKVKTADSEVTLSNRLNYALTKGPHTVQTFLVSQAGGTMYAYQVDYSIHQTF